MSLFLFVKGLDKKLASHEYLKAFISLIVFSLFLTGYVYLLYWLLIQKLDSLSWLFDKTDSNHGVSFWFPRIIMPIIVPTVAYFLGFMLWAIILGIIEFCSIKLYGVKDALYQIFFRKNKKEIINSEDYKELNRRYKEAMSTVSKELEEKCQKDNDICPKCRNKGSVDAFQRIKGSVDGDSFLGCGSLSGSLDTKTVNHCPKCGHEWKKTKEKSYKDRHEKTIELIFWNLYYWIDHIDYNQKDDFLKKLSAKAVKTFIKDELPKEIYTSESLKKLSVSDLKAYGCQ